MFSTHVAYIQFEHHVRRESRYFLDESAQLFLRNVLATSEKRKRSLKEGAILWRAQLGNDLQPLDEQQKTFEMPVPLAPSRMRPRRDGAREGRVNSKGIPTLYLARDEVTAMAEVRPSVGSYVSVGQFKTLKELVYVDCSVGHATPADPLKYFLKRPSAKEIEEAVWSDIDRAFAKPVAIDDSSADYAATQIISELFRKEGCGGISYKSSLGPGLNFALFDIDSADIINCFLFRVESVKYGFSEVKTPYFIRQNE